MARTYLITALSLSLGKPPAEIWSAGPVARRDVAGQLQNAADAIAEKTSERIAQALERKAVGMGVMLQYVKPGESNVVSQGRYLVHLLRVS